MLAVGFLAAVIFSGNPFFKGETQKQSPQPPDNREALAGVRENATASRFYDKLKTTESDLVLENFRAPAPIDEPSKPITMVFKRGAEEVRVLITEYESAEGAKSPFAVQMNVTIKPNNTRGDYGVSYYSNYGSTAGKFSGMAFRKDRFYVLVASGDEKLAERLAGYADETITALL